MAITRRNFLIGLAGAVAASQIPLSALESRKGEYSVKYVEAYDIFSNRLIRRVDVSRGVKLELPAYLQKANRIDDVSREYVISSIKALKFANTPDAALTVLARSVRDIKIGEIVSVAYPTLAYAKVQ